MYNHFFFCLCSPPQRKGSRLHQKNLHGSLSCLSQTANTVPTATLGNYSPRQVKESHHCQPGGGGGCYTMFIIGRPDLHWLHPGLHPAKD